MSRVVVIPVHDRTELIVRDGPGGSRVGVVSVGQQGSIVADQRNGQVARDDHHGGTHRWVKVRFDTGRVGFVADEFLEAIEAAPVARPASPSRSTDPSASSSFSGFSGFSELGAGGGGGGVLFGLFALAVAAACIWWFVTVVLPILLGIAAGFFALWLVVKSYQRFGARKTFGALAVLIGVPLFVVWYREHFTGDFEADRDEVVLRSAAQSLAPACASVLFRGNNLSCAGRACETTDTLEGRWVRVHRDGEDCWGSYATLRFQHGIFMSLVDQVVRLRSTNDDNLAALAQQRAEIDRSTQSMLRQSNWTGLADLGTRLTGQGIAVPLAITQRIEEGSSRRLYESVLQRAGSGPALDRGALVAFARSLPFPREKPEIRALARSWARRDCEAALAALRASESSPADSLRALLISAPKCDEGEVSLDEGVTLVVQRIEDAVAERPRDKVAWLEAMSSDGALGRSCSTVSRARLASALVTAREAAHVADLTAAAAPSGTRSEEVLAARCVLASDPALPQWSPRDEARVRSAVERAVREDFLSYAHATARGLALPRELTFLRRGGTSETPTVIGAHPRVMGVGTSPCGDRSNVDYETRARGQLPVRAQQSMCYLRSAERWDPCARTEAP